MKRWVKIKNALNNPDIAPIMNPSAISTSLVQAIVIILIEIV